MSETQQGQGIDRREAIRRVTAMLGGVALTGGGTLLTAVERAHARARAVRQVGTFTAQDIALLDEVADTILPETKTPGAKAAHTGAFMALMVTDTYDERQQAIFRDGMQKLNDAAFIPPNQGAHAARLLHLGDRLYAGDALPGDTGAVRPVCAVHAGRDAVGGARLGGAPPQSHIRR